MSDQPKLYIAGIGMITPVGANTAMTAAAVRAGVSAFQPTGFYLDDDNYVRMARVPREALDVSLNNDLPEDFTARQIRLMQLATLALVQIKPALPKNQKIPLFIAGPEQLIEGDQPMNGAFLENLSKQTGINFDLPLSRVISTGRAGGLAVFNLAFRYLASSNENFVVVAGVDTFYDGQILQQLLQDDRLLVGGNMDGFIPGEGAAFLLLSRHQIPQAKDNVRTVTLCDPGLGNEPGHRESQEPYRGDGLAAAVAKALGNSKTAKIKTLYSSMNGEHFFAKEHGVALLRNGHLLEENMKIEHPADCFGDLGAAFGPVMTGIISVHLMNNHAASPCMVCCSSDKAPRAAMVMHA